MNQRAPAVQRRPRVPRPRIQPRSFASMAAPRGPVKRGIRMPAPRNIPNKMPRIATSKIINFWN